MPLLFSLGDLYQTGCKNNVKKMKRFNELNGKRIQNGYEFMLKNNIKICNLPLRKKQIKRKE